MASVKKREDGKYRARYRDGNGKEIARHFTRKVDAQRWLDEVTTSVVTGNYVDPKAGKITFEEHAEAWRKKQVHRPGTVEHVERSLRLHFYPVLGDRRLSGILPSDIQALVKTMSQTLSPATVGVVYRYTSTVFKSAVADRRIPSSPCAGVKLPKETPAKVVPLSTDVVVRLTEAVPQRYRAMVVLAAGTGMRQGEIFGLTTDRVDFLRRSLRVDRQLVSTSGHEPTFGPPKTAASSRDIPLPTVVVEALARHVELLPPGPEGLLFTGTEGQKLRRSAFGNVWRKTARDAGVEGTVFHALRHYYASLLIRHGESVKTVQARLGHANAAETLDTYSHLWPDSDDRTRDAVDLVLGTPADSVRTEAK